MKPYKSKGIIFRTLKYSETSIISDIYTREKGLKSFIVSGVRTSKSGSKAAIYQNLNIVELVANDVESDRLSRINEIRLDHHYQLVNRNVIHSAVAIFILEVCRQSIKEKECNSDLYDFLEKWLKLLDEKALFHPCLHHVFMIQLSNELGFGPLNNFSMENRYFDLAEGIFSSENINHDTISEIESISFNQLLLYEKNPMAVLNWQKQTRDIMTNLLIKYFKYHIDGFKDLNSLEVLRNIL